ncbi:MAG: S-layer homology domain-containing protein [Oscillospiraceae bacterium]|nr:S-layer homology domain-containing protein [Oscillospiraceae bacterium]
MSKWKRRLAALLTAALLISCLPAAALAEEPAEELLEESTEELLEEPAEELPEEPTEDPAEEPTEETAEVDNMDVVFYNTGSVEFLLFCEADGDALAENAAYAGYLNYGLCDTFNDDGSYTIQLENNAFFPYEVQFRQGDDIVVEWFMSPDDTVDYAGHEFSVYSASDGAALTRLTLTVGGREVTVWPEEKEFTVPDLSDSDTIGDDEDAISFEIGASLLPLEEKRLWVDLEYLLPGELSNVSVNAVFNDENADVTPAVWASGYNSDDFILLDEDVGLDLTPTSNYTSYVYGQLIAGTVDQLDLDNTRYIITAYITPINRVYNLTDYGYDELFYADAYTAGETREEIIIDSAYYATFTDTSTYTTKEYFRIMVGSDNWSGDDEAYLGIGLTDSENLPYDLTNLTATVYEGYYESEEDALADDAQIIEDIWEQENIATEGGHLADYSQQSGYSNMPEITVVLKRNGNTALVMPMVFYMKTSRSGMYLRFYDVYNLEGSSVEYSYNRTTSTEGEKTTVYVTSLDDELYVQMYILSQGILDKEDVDLVEYVVVGNYGTAEEIYALIEEDATADIKDQLFSYPGYLGDYSEGIVFSALDIYGDVLVVEIVTELVPASISFEGIYSEEDGYYTYIASDYDWNDDGQITVTLNYGYPADGNYYLRMCLDGYYYISDRGLSRIAYAVEGSYDTVAEIQAAVEADASADIKELLFSSTSGYPADYSEGISFSVLDTDGNIHHVTVITVEGEPAAAMPASQDTYFRMNAAYKTEDSTSSGSIRYYVMPYDVDSYYYIGYQTVFLMNYGYDSDEGAYVYSPVTDESIVPVFYTGTNVTVFASADATSGEKQVSGDSERTFESGQAIEYSAAAEDGTHLKNYMVTFLTQQSGPKLFVNGTNDESNYTDVTLADGTTESIPERVIYLNEYFDYHHDIFFANIGDEDITGLYVRLEDAKNIALDDYWTIGETTTLSAFTTTATTTSYGELVNVGKIRLVAATDENDKTDDGLISGILVIGYTTDDGEHEEVRINLTGIAGDPQITTDTLLNGVKYVPYSSVIQTSDMYSTNNSFEVIEGTLPGNMELKPNGELYGVPTEYGTFTFTVQVTFTASDSDSGIAYSDERVVTKEFTLEILENTDENVDAVNTDEQQGYKLLERIEEEINLKTMASDAEYVFWSEGALGEFMDFYLDGEKLIKGTDYIAEDGSTKITIEGQTFANSAAGTHTIAGEFRSGGDEDGTLKRSAQNVTVTNPTTSGGGGGGGGSTTTTTNTSTSYTVTVSSPVNGTVTSSAASAAKNSTITLTVAPEGGYALESLTVTAADGTDVALTQASDTTYTFTMPGGNVTVQASFSAVYDHDCPSAHLTDVGVNAWYHEAVDYVVENGLMIGTATNAFSPDMETSRGMIVMILYRMAGAPEVSGEFGFSDVEASDYYASAVSWAAENGIVEGYGDGSFGPDDAITRERMAAILYRYAQYKGYDTTQDDMAIREFGDYDDVSDYALEAMAWCINIGIIQGTDSATIAPQESATRAQIAAILMRFIESISAD